MKSEVSKVSQITISFGEPVNLPDGFERALDGFIGMVCEQYQRENPTRVMWPSGHGHQPQWRGGEIVGFDLSTYSIECTERDDFHGENEHNPNHIALRAAAIARRKAAKAEREKGTQ